MRVTLTLSLIGMLLLHSVAFAASTRGVVATDSLTSTTISIKVAGKTKRKLIYCSGKIPGAAKSATGGMLFTPFSTTLSQLRAKKVKGDKLATYVQLNSVGKKSCSKIQNGGGAPTPTPTPTSPATDNFYGNGDVTTLGKATFQIPAQLSGNIGRGKLVVQSYCSCHEERLNYTFPSLRTGIAPAPMFFDSSAISDSTLADITAYLNRFR